MRTTKDVCQLMMLRYTTIRDANNLLTTETNDSVTVPAKLFRALIAMADTP